MINVRVCYWYCGIMYLMSVVEVVVVCWDCDGGVVREIWVKWRGNVEDMVVGMCRSDFIMCV